MHIKVRVTPNSKEELFQQKTENSFLVNVKEPSERNLANKRVRKLIAGYFLVAVNKVVIVSGHHRPNKIFSVIN